jgi:mono/diheme cytochrome c family protein
MSPPHDGRTLPLPVLPLLAAVGLIVLIAAGWAMAKAWETHSDDVNIARAMTGGDPSRAAALVTRYGCGGCHTITGLPGAQGVAAPPLTNLRERVYIGGVLPNTAQNLVDWIVNPRRFNPHTAMPASGVTQDEARDIAAYLYTQ